MLISRLLPAALVTLSLSAPGPALAADSGVTTTWIDPPAATGNTADWSDPENWSHGVPGPDDTAIIPSPPAERAGFTVKLDAPVTVARLVVDRQPGKGVTIHDGHSGAGSITVTDRFEWSGGVIQVDLTLGPDSSAVLGRGSAKEFGDDADDRLTIHGDLHLDQLGHDEAGRVGLLHSADLVVAETGTMVVTGDAWLRFFACCAANNETLVNHGTVRITEGRTHLDRIELATSGTVHVERGAVLDLDGGLQRSDSATYAGGGTVRVRNTEQPAADPSSPGGVRGGFVLAGTQRMEDGTVIEVGDAGDVAGVGDIAGTGTVRLRGGTWWARTRLGPAIRFQTVGGTTSSLGNSDGTTRGLVGSLTLRRDAGLAPGSALVVAPGAKLLVPARTTLRVPNGARLATTACCTSPAQVVVDGTMVLGGGIATGPARLDGLDLGGAGALRMSGRTRWNVDPGHHFTGVLTGSGTVLGDLAVANSTLRPTGPVAVTGDLMLGARGSVRSLVAGRRAPVAPARISVAGEALLRGRLVVDARRSWPAGARVSVLRYGTNAGTRFAKVRAPGWKVRYGKRGLDLVAR